VTSAITDQTASHITRVEELAYELKIADVMARQLRTVPLQAPLSEVLDLLRQARISGAPVMDGERLAGVLSLEDVVRAMRDGQLSATAARYMTPQVITVRDTDPVITALEQFAKVGVGRLPVLNDANQLVGVLTKGDISRGLLRSLQSTYQAEELRRYRASHLFEDIESDHTSLILRYTVKSQDFAHGGHASSCVKRALARLGATPEIARRCGIALYEAEMNLIIHTREGGFIRLEIDPDRIIMKVVDDGPGIPDVDLAMRPGYSTAPESVRALGFGAGMGLPNMRRCADEMKMSSTPELGTKIEMRLFLRPPATTPDFSAMRKSFRDL
jgi:CBS domain-containing protein/anti-sigma regulatory factor (Ser/Thr protein kinase)